jgi:hypothetical protein
MDRETLTDALERMGYEDSILFESPSYISAVIGISDTGQVCYSYNKMIESLMEEDSMTPEEAMEFIDYNTVRALPYCHPSEKRPIIIYDDIEY